jgi:serine/threonine-protein kinase
VVSPARDAASARRDHYDGAAQDVRMLGTRIGNYEVISQIGEGGMGAVYRARHAVLARGAAVKVLLPALSHDRGNLTRFFNEARAATAIRHPGIVEVYDFGSLADGSAYIVMELLDGETLAARIRRAGPQPRGPWLPLVRQMAGALHAAHEAGIVHRDLKPDNVFLVRDPEVDGGERIKLLDFGIAKLTTTLADTSKTRTGAVMGTPTYMSPEQCRDAGLVDRRADLYALGCILYELACGRPPFVAHGAGDLIAHHLYFEPQPPSALQPTIAPALERLIVQLLQKQPEARPATATAVIEALDRVAVELGVGMPRTMVVRAATDGTGPVPLAVPAMTTLSAAAGTREHGEVVRARRWPVTAAVAAVVIGVGGWLVLRGGSSGAHGGVDAGTVAVATTPSHVVPPPDAALAADATVAAFADAASPAEVTFAIDSDPPGAEVLDGATVIGRTPLAWKVPRAGAVHTFTLRLRGHVPSTIVLPASTDGSARVVLRAERKRRATATPAAPKPTPAAPPKPKTKQRPRDRHSDGVGNGGLQPFEDLD